MYTVKFDFDINLGARLVPNTTEGLTITSDREYKDPICQEWMMGGETIQMDYLPKEGDIIDLFGFLSEKQLKDIDIYTSNLKIAIGSGLQANKIPGSDTSVSLYRPIKTIIFEYDNRTKKYCHVAWITDFKNTIYPCDIV